MNFSNADQVAVEIAYIRPKLLAEIATITRRYTSMLRSEIIRNASQVHHRPGGPRIPGASVGPQVGTGDYIRSWDSKTEVSASRIVGEAFTNAPQARRLEFGFVGTDALGRTYDQPPYPHAQPAFDVISPQYQAALAAAVAKGVR